MASGDQSTDVVSRDLAGGDTQAGLLIVGETQHQSTPPDPVTQLVRLRAEMDRIAAEVEGLVDCASIASVRAMAPRLAERMRDAALAPDMVKACKR